MKRDKPKSAHRGLRAATLIVRTLGIILLVLLLAVASIIGIGLFNARDNLGDAEFLGCRAIIAEGYDMQPVICKGALVFVKTGGLEVEKEAMIAYAPTPGSAPVLTRVWNLGEPLTVCQDNQPSDTAQTVFQSQLVGVVPGDFGIFPKPVGIWNGAAPIVNDIRTDTGAINWTGVAKWGGIFVGVAFVFALLWFILEWQLAGHKRRSKAQQEHEDVFSLTDSPNFAADQAPTIKQTPDGQPVAVFPAATAPGMPDDKADTVAVSVAPVQSGNPVQQNRPQPIHPLQATFPTLPRTAPPRPSSAQPAPPPRAEQAFQGGQPTALPSQPILPPTLPDVPADHIATDDEFAAMLQSFEQNFN
ncbi:MAG: hypothetical protein LBJ12_04550 [Oscillospiraceae bacterium]|jgi:Na+-transporting methylmalonyl-CoA/oxaloacetate decarboxylase gamma subunit|nr:hypothetical protein [Oscillospiraceae bacterium]